MVAMSGTLKFIQCRQVYCNDSVRQLLSLFATVIKMQQIWIKAFLVYPQNIEIKMEQQDFALYPHPLI